MWTNYVCTFVEVGGLLFIIAVGAGFGAASIISRRRTQRSMRRPNAASRARLFDADDGRRADVFLVHRLRRHAQRRRRGKEPRRTMPWGIILALAIVATFLYIGVAVTAVSVVDHRDLPPDASALAMVASRRHRGCRRGHSTSSRCSPCQHGADQLHHGLAFAVRHGPARIVTRRARPRSSRANSPCRDTHVARGGVDLAFPAEKKLSTPWRRRRDCCCLFSFMVVNTGTDRPEAAAGRTAAASKCRSLFRRGRAAECGAHHAHRVTAANANPREHQSSRAHRMR